MRQGSQRGTQTSREERGQGLDLSPFPPGEFKSASPAPMRKPKHALVALAEGSHGDHDPRLDRFAIGRAVGFVAIEAITRDAGANSLLGLLEDRLYWNAEPRQYVARIQHIAHGQNSQLFR